MMKSGLDKEYIIIKVLREELIKIMNVDDPTIIPVGVLMGLHDLIEETEE
jgi:hypothetical protein